MTDQQAAQRIEQIARAAFDQLQRDAPDRTAQLGEHLEDEQMADARLAVYASQRVASYITAMRATVGDQLALHLLHATADSITAHPMPASDQNAS